MKLWTAQMRYNGEDRVDVTVKSGEKVFAPTWDMVMGHKRGTISDEEYTEAYYAMMRQSYIENFDVWIELCSKDEVTLVCFCPKGAFCHRVLLATLLEKVCKFHDIPFEYMGER
jgi:uncharacterized protein YeaO (DUF488 family)